MVGFASLSIVLIVYLSDSNGRISQFPRGYSQALTSVIKSLLNLTVSVTQFLTDRCYQLRLQPAMRPSAAQLLQHEQLELFNRLADSEKMQVQSTLPHPIFVSTPLFSFRFSVAKAHHPTVAPKDREILAREQALLQNK